MAYYGKGRCGECREPAWPLAQSSSEIEALVEDAARPLAWELVGSWWEAAGELSLCGQSLQVRSWARCYSGQLRARRSLSYSVLCRRHICHLKCNFSLQSLHPSSWLSNSAYAATCLCPQLPNAALGPGRNSVSDVIAQCTSVMPTLILAAINKRDGLKLMLVLSSIDFSGFTARNSALGPPQSFTGWLLEISIHHYFRILPTASSHV